MGCRLVGFSHEFDGVAESVLFQEGFKKKRDWHSCDLVCFLVAGSFPSHSAVVSGADFDDASVDSAGDTVVFCVEVRGQICALFSEFSCQGWFNKRYWPRNLLSFVGWDHGSA